jgi:hypothetical protein
MFKAEDLLNTLRACAPIRSERIAAPLLAFIGLTVAYGQQPPTVTISVYPAT